MKYKLSRQSINSEISNILAREIKKQKAEISKVTKSNLKEIAQVVKAIEKTGLPKYLICRKLSNQLGHGIFLHPDASPIEKGQVIAPYAGIVSIVPQSDFGESSYAFAPIERMLLTKEEQLYFDKKQKYHPRRRYSLKVDADKKGNFTRFINHSEKPNVVAYLYSIPANSYGLEPARIEIIYIAKKRIHPGEQLLVSYEADEKSYWGPAKIKPFPMTPKTFRLSPSLKLIRS